MSRKFILQKRQNTILYSEFLITAGIVALLAFGYYKIHPAVALLIAIVSIFIFVYLFFTLRIFRYIFSISFSIGWAYGAFLLGQKLETSSNTTAWVFSLITFCICIWAHWDHFDFLKTAKIYEYEQR